MGEWGPILEVVETAGALGLLVLILWSGYRETWVWGKMHRATVDELRSDRNEWKAIALAGTELAEKAVQAASPGRLR